VLKARRDKEVVFIMFVLALDLLKAAMVDYPANVTQPYQRERASITGFRFKLGKIM
jgi:hypothetical protein